MKYEIKRTCGHTETVDIYGSASERENKVKWYESTDCTECYTKSLHPDCKEVEMLYSEYKNNYADCKTKSGSYDKKAKTVIVYVQE